MTDQLIAVAGAKNPDGSYVLPDATGVRAHCDYEDVSYPEYRAHGKTCKCQGRGWNASRDLAVYLSMPDLFHHIEIDWENGIATVVLTPNECSSDESGLPWGRSNDLLRAVADALARALVAQGAKFGGTGT